MPGEGAAPDASIAKFAGVTRTMADKVYRVLLCKRTGKGGSPDTTEPRNPEERRNGPNPIFGFTGATLGSLVHKQIHDWVWVARGVKKVGWEGGGFPPCSSHPSPQTFRTLHPFGMHPRAKLFFDKLKSKHWRAFRTEFPIYSPALAMATKIDTLAADRRGRIIFIELKTGYVDGRFVDATSEALEWTVPELRAMGWPCSPQNRAAVQLVLGVWVCVAAVPLPTYPPLSQMVLTKFSLPVAQIKMRIVRVGPCLADLQRVTHDDYKRLTLILIPYLLALR